jgi:NAD-dependent dihydropyrimidine dehydrogenase PreA subunit
MKELRYLSGVVTLKFDENKCNGCLTCLEVCPHGVFGAYDNRVSIIDRDACMECAACVQNCESFAITVASGAGCAAMIAHEALKRLTNKTCDEERAG